MEAYGVMIIVIGNGLSNQISTLTLGSQTDIQHSLFNAVFMFSFNIFVSHSLEFVSFFWTSYWSTT